MTSADDDDPLADLADVSNQTRLWVAERDRLIRHHRDHGASWGHLAKASRLSRSGVIRIYERESSAQDRTDL